MTGMNARGGIKEASIEIVVIRADGTKEELGVVSYWHKNPFKRFIHKLRSNSGDIRT